MKGFAKRILPILIALVIGVIGFAAIGCGGDDKKPATPAGTPVVYYSELGETEYKLTVTGKAFTLTYGDVARAGTVAEADGNITLTFVKSNGETAIGKKTGTVIDLTYGGVAMRFYEDVYYTVSFNTDGGTAVGGQSVRNGKYAQEPAAPMRNGYVFVGWYTDDSYSAEYDFAERVVTDNVVVYARWTVSLSTVEFTVGFDLNYDGAPEVESMQTKGGIIFNPPVPTRDGYEFKGWWVSMTGKVTELAYMLKDDVIIKENTTLYALWQPTAAGDKLHAPVVDVTVTGISWQSVGMTANGYEVSVTYPDKHTEKNTVSGVSMDIDFAALPAGDYTISVVARSSAGEDKYSDPTVRVYRNKALARVSVFEVETYPILVYNKVDNATRYTVYIDCGSGKHVADNKGSTAYNFGNCAMQKGGIEFYVVAEADGYVPSTSEVFVYNRDLPAIAQADVKYDAATETVSWTAVENATEYSVTVNDEPVRTVKDTSIDIREYNAGTITIGVRPVAAGYNSPEATEIIVSKTSLATPANVRIDGSTVKWDDVAGATKYVVELGGKSFEVTSGAVGLDLTTIDLQLADGEECSITVKAASATNESLRTDGYALVSNKMSPDLEYDGGVITWKYVFGATGYDVRVNGDEAKRVTGANRSAVTLTQRGDNVIEVRYVSGDKTSEWVSKTVVAYAMGFNLNGATGDIAAHYYAYGDTVNLPAVDEDARPGYEFNGWYTSPSGIDDGGRLYDNEAYNVAADTVLYAGWKPATYTVTLNYMDKIVGSVKTVEVTYGEKFNIPMETKTTDSGYTFVGWADSAADGAFLLTDDKGDSLGVWNVTSDATVYASYIGFTLEKQSDDTYWITGTDASAATSVILPYEYKGEDDDKAYPVSSVVDKAFNKLTAVTRITIPNSLDYIGNGAFSSRITLKQIEVYEVDGVFEPKYESEDGVLLYNNELTLSVEVWAYPRAKADAVYTLPSRVTSIPGNNAFYYSLFEEVVVPATVNYVGTGAFRSNTLRKVTFEPDSTYDGTGAPQALTIEGAAFRYCTGVTEITLPARFDDNFNVDMFYNINALTTVNLDSASKYRSVNGMVYLPGTQSTLVFCPNGISGKVTIPDVITAIGEHSFSGCRNITEVVIPNTVSKIEKQAFSGYRMSIDGTSATIDVYGCSALEKVTFKGGNFIGISIGDSAFGYNPARYKGRSHVDAVRCGKLTQIVFESGCNIKEIGAWAFSGVPISSIQIPNSVTKLSDNAFAYCDELVSFSFEVATSAEQREALIVGDGIFLECTKLETMYLPYYINLSGNYGIFEGCSKLSTVTVDPLNPYISSVDGAVFDAAKETIYFYPFSKSGVYNLPATVKTIGAGVFVDKINLTGITIHSNVTVIGNGAFKGCTGLTSVVFDGTWTDSLTIGAEAFSGCYKLASVTLPEKTNVIGNFAFYNCSQLVEINIPTQAHTIGSSAFQGCIKLVGNNTTKTLVIPKSVTSIYDNAFQGCTSLVKVVFEDERTQSLTFYDSTDNWGKNVTAQNNEKVFADCTSLVEVSLTEGIKNLSGYMFAGDTKLAKISIPTTVEYIASNVFMNCRALEDFSFVERTGATPTSLELFEAKDNNNTEIFAFSHLPIEHLVLPEGLNRIPYRAFNGMKNLKTVSVPSTVRSNKNFMGPYTNTGAAIDISAFADCKKLTTVSCADSATGEFFFGTGAFSGCVELTSVTLPSVFVIKYNTSATAQANEMAANVFGGCTKLNALNIIEGTANKTHTDATYGYVLNASRTEIIYAPAFVGGDIVIPASINSIANKAFTGNTKITSVTFAEGEGADLTIGNDSTTTATAPFASCTNLTSVTFPARLKSIGKYAFYNCVKLESVSFGESSNLQTINTNAFQYCYALTEIVLPDELTSLGANAFARCIRLTTVSIPNTVGNFGAAFLGSASLDTVIIRAIEGRPSVLNTVDDAVVYSTSTTAGVTTKKLEYVPLSYAPANGEFVVASGTTEIGASVFSYNGNIKTINIPNTVHTIGNTAFYMCDNLTDVIFDDDGAGAASTLTVGNNAFADSVKLKSVNFPARLTTVGTNTFQYCSSLTSVTFADGCKLAEIPTGFFQYTGAGSITIPASVKTIAEGAFRYSALTSVNIPKTVATMNGQYIFAESTKLSTVTFEAGRTDNITLGNYMFQKCTALTSLTLPDRLLNTGTNMCNGCTSLTAITIPSTTETLGANAFTSCSKLVTVTFAGTADAPASLITLGNSAFSSCKALTSIDLPKSLVTFGTGVFSSTGLTELTIPGKVSGFAWNTSSILSNAPVTKVIFEDGEREHFFIPNGVLYNLTKLTEVRLPNDLEGLGRSNTTPSGPAVTGNPAGAGLFYGTAITSITIPASVKYVGGHIFQNCKQLESVIFQGDVVGDNGWDSSMSGVNSQMFVNCTKLKTVVLPNGIVTLGPTLFKNLTALENVTLPDTIKEIPANTFSGSGIQSINIPASVTSISASAFENCTRLTDITFEAGTNPLAIGANAFKGSGLTAFEVPARVTEIVNTPFADCSALASITFEQGSTLRTIGAEAFRGSPIKSIDIPASVVTIGDRAFYGSAVETVNFTSDSELTTIGTEAFAYSMLHSFVIPAKVATIGGSPFYMCNNLEVLGVGSGNANYSLYGGSILYNGDMSVIYTVVSSLVEGELVLENISEIASGAFAGSKITSLVIRNSDNGEFTIGANAFADCAELTTIELGQNAIIGYQAFMGCGKLTDVTLGAHATLNSRVFEACTTLSAVSVAEDTAIGLDIYKDIPTAPTVTGEENVVVRHRGYEITETEDGGWYITITGNVADNEFAGDTVLRGVKIVGAASIGAHAFQGCTALETVEIADSVTSIGLGAFQGCTSLKSMVTPLAGGHIPNNVTANNVNTFSYLFGVTSISASNVKNNVPASLTSIVFTGSYVVPAQAFRYLVNVEYLEFTNPAFDATSQNVCNGDTKLKKVVIGGNPTYIGANMFYGCTVLADVTIPDSVTSYGANAFQNAKAITSFTIPESMTAIPANMFYGCTGLTSITIPAAVESIGDSAFSGCTGVKSLTFATDENGNRALTTLGKEVFKSCKMTTVTVPGSLVTVGASIFDSCAELTTAVIEDGVTAITEKMFYGCTKLNSVTIPDSVTSYGTSAFQNAKGLTSFVIPEGITAIPVSMFNGCAALSSVTIASTVRTIGNTAFTGCTGLVSVTFEKDEDGKSELYSFGNDVFKNCTKITTVIIPDSLYVIGTGCFDGWTAAQTINMECIEAIRYSYPKTWVGTCKANIVWDYEQPAPEGGEVTE